MKGKDKFLAQVSLRQIYVIKNIYVKYVHLFYCKLRTINYICRPKIKTLHKMKKGIHPENYRFVVFKDMSNDYTFLSKSTAETKDTIKWEDGKEYPLIKMEISNMSHPFYTGKMKLVDTAGRVDKFRSRYQKKEQK